MNGPLAPAGSSVVTRLLACEGREGWGFGATLYWGRTGNHWGVAKW